MTTTTTTTTHETENNDALWLENDEWAEKWFETKRTPSFQAAMVMPEIFDSFILLSGAFICFGISNPLNFVTWVVLHAVLKCERKKKEPATSEMYYGMRFLTDRITFYSGIGRFFGDISKAARMHIKRITPPRSATNSIVPTNIFNWWIYAIFTNAIF